jgi:hypothetical protein
MHSLDACKALERTNKIEAGSSSIFDQIDTKTSQNRPTPCNNIKRSIEQRPAVHEVVKSNHKYMMPEMIKRIQRQLTSADQIMQHRTAK